MSCRREAPIISTRSKSTEAPGGSRGPLEKMNEQHSYEKAENNHAQSGTKPLAQHSDPQAEAFTGVENSAPSSTISSGGEAPPEETAQPNAAQALQLTESAEIAEYPLSLLQPPPWPSLPSFQSLRSFEMLKSLNLYCGRCNFRHQRLLDCFTI